LLLEAHETLLLFHLTLTVKSAARYDAWFMGLIVLRLGTVGTSGRTKNYEKHKDQWAGYTALHRSAIWTGIVICDTTPTFTVLPNGNRSSP